MANGKVYRDGGTTGDQSNYGLVGVPHSDNTNGGDSPFSSVNYSLAPVPRDEANLEAEKGETVLTDMNNDGNYELYDIGGNRHFSGGTPLSLPPQSFIYSDTAKMKLNKYELNEMGIESKKRISPAKVSKNYQLNNFISLLDNEHSDHITRDTADYMLDKNKKSLSHLAFLQEARKKFDDGVPLAAYPYLQGKGINPLEFSQQMEQISAQEAEEKMMMQLPIEDQLQLLQMKKQQAMMMQQQQMAQQQQQQQQGMGFQEAPQQGMPPQGGPMHQMPDGSMMPGATHGEAPQGGGMPPQGMMPPQPPMQQPPMQQPAMARRGGQISQLLPKAQMGINNFMMQKSWHDNVIDNGSIQDNTQILPAVNKYEILNDNSIFETGTVGTLDAPIVPTTEQILEQYQVANNKLMTDFTNQTNSNMNAYQKKMNSMVPPHSQQMSMLGVTGATDPAKIEIWEEHINKGGSPPTSPDPNYTQAYKNIHGGEEPEYINDSSTPAGSNDPNITNVYNIQNGTEEGEELQSSNYLRMPNQNNNSDQPDNVTGRAQGLPLDYSNTNSPYYVGSDWSFATGGDLPKAQYSINDSGLEEGDILDNASINFGNKKSPDLMLGQKFVNNVSEENVEGGYMNSGDNTIVGYDGWNAGLDINNLIKSGQAMGNKTNFDRSNNIFNVDRSLGFNAGLNNSRTSLSGEGRAGLGFAQGVIPGATRENSYPYPAFTPISTPTYLNPYMSGNIDMDFDAGNNSAFGVGMSYDTPLSPYGTGLGANASYKTGPLDFQIGLDNKGTNFGASYTFGEGGGLPSYQTTGELEDESVTINAGNTTRPDLLFSGRNFNSEEDMFYHNPLGFEDVNVQKYTGVNLGINPLAVNKVPFGFSHSTGNEKMDIVDRSNTIANLDLSTGINVGSLNDRTRGYAEGRGGFGWGLGNTWSPTFPNSPGNTSMSSRQSHYLNPYLSGEAGVDFGLGNDESIGLKGSLNTALSPYGTGLGAGINLNKGNFSLNAGLDNMLSGSPTTNFGASYTFDEGGELPMAKRGKEVKYKGNTYSEKELNKLRKSKDPNQIALYNEIMQIDTRNKQEIANDQTSKINKSRENTAAVTLEDQVFSGGSDDWATDYLADSPAAEEYRKSRYDAYVDRRKSKGKDVIGEQEYHNAYATMQQHNAYFEKNLTQEQRNTTDWDDGTNDKYHSSLENSGMSPLTDEMVGHVQSGYIGGQALALTGDEYTDFMQSGVKDQSVFGLAISPEDEKFGNTTNDQRESYTRNESTEEIGCTNAAGMEAACVEIGGTWTPWDETAKTGCSCDKQIPPEKIPPPEITTKKDTPFWLQDELGMANALDAKMSLKKRYPWAPHYDQIGIDGVFDDPTREIAAISEQAGIAASAATAFGGPQRAASAALATQGKAMTAIADTVNKVHTNNIKTGNDLNIKNAEMEYKTQMLNNNELKQLYDNTVLTEENYDNSLRKANAAITAQVQNAYTNRANTANLNSIYPQFDIDPSSGGMLTNVNNKTFHADPNYVDPATYDDSYAKQIEMLRKNKVPENLWPKYTPPGAPNSNNSFAKQNAAVITSSGYQGQPARFGRETVRKDRILRKGGQLRNWFSPLRGN